LFRNDDLGVLQWFKFINARFVGHLTMHEPGFVLERDAELAVTKVIEAFNMIFLAIHEQKSLAAMPRQ